MLLSPLFLLQVGHNSLINALLNICKFSSRCSSQPRVLKKQRFDEIGTCIVARAFSMLVKNVGCIGRIRIGGINVAVGRHKAEPPGYVDNVGMAQFQPIVNVDKILLLQTPKISCERVIVAQPFHVHSGIDAHKFTGRVDLNPGG